MNKKVSTVLLALCLWLFAIGCTSRAWYEGMRERQRQDCYKYQSRDEIQRCLDRVNTMSYDEYKREREKSD